MLSEYPGDPKGPERRLYFLIVIGMIILTIAFGPIMLKITFGHLYRMRIAGYPWVLYDKKDYEKHFSNISLQGDYPKYFSCSLINLNINDTYYLNKTYYLETFLPTRKTILVLFIENKTQLDLTLEITSYTELRLYQVPNLYISGLALGLDPRFD